MFTATLNSTNYFISFTKYNSEIKPYKRIKLWKKAASIAANLGNRALNNNLGRIGTKLAEEIAITAAANKIKSLSDTNVVKQIIAPTLTNIIHAETVAKHNKKKKTLRILKKLPQK